MKDTVVSRAMLYVLLAVLVFAVAAPALVNAGPANAMCNPVYPSCPPMQKPGAKGCEPGMNMFQMPCQETVNGGTTMGKCLAPNYCHGESHSGGGGEQGGGLGMQQLMQAMSGIMSALKGGGGGGGGGSGSGSGSGSGGSSGGSAGCTSYRQTNDISNTDPCAYYVPGAASSSYYYYQPGTGGGGGDSSGCTAYHESNVENDPDPCAYYVPAPKGDGSTEVIGDAGGEEAGPTSTPANSDDGFISRLLKTIAGLGNGTEGNIKVDENGVTIYAGGINKETNTGVAGFYGSDTFGGQPQGIVAQLCVNRPWAGGLVSAVIPASFFDNLCKWRGYQVGAFTGSGDVAGLIQLSTVLLRNNGNSDAAQAPVKMATPAVANIWAVPPAVPVGARTSVFWTSKLVKSCEVTSSDGSFHETALAGGASTVPLAGATTFTIKCVAADDTEVTNSVLVTIKI